MSTHDSIADLLEAGVAHFDAGRYFEAHERWEDAWRRSTGPTRALLQTLIQLAVALHHRERGNLIGARHLLQKAQANAATLPYVCEQVKVAELTALIDDLLAALERGSRGPELPRVGWMRAQADDGSAS